MENEKVSLPHLEILEEQSLMVRIGDDINKLRQAFGDGEGFFKILSLIQDSDPSKTSLLIAALERKKDVEDESKKKQIEESIVGVRSLKGLICGSNEHQFISQIKENRSAFDYNADIRLDGMLLTDWVANQAKTAVQQIQHIPSTTTRSPTGAGSMKAAASGKSPL